MDSNATNNNMSVSNVVTTKTSGTSDATNVLTASTSSTNIDWVTKLSSRKFWVALIGFLTPMLVAFGVTDSKIAEVSSIIMAGGTLIAYILCEGFVDSARIKSNSSTTSTSTVMKIDNTQDSKVITNDGEKSI